MEIWDLYTKDKQLTKKRIRRGEKIPSGLLHMVVHFWPKDENGRYLIQKRSEKLERFPGIWAETGGSAFSGETSKEAVIRETFEELGISLNGIKLSLIKTLYRIDNFVDIWTANISSNIIKKFIPTEEVDAVDFKYPEEIAVMMKKGTFYKFEKEYLKVIDIHL